MRRRIGSFLIAALWLGALAAPAAAIEPERLPPAPHRQPTGTPPPLKTEGSDKLAKGSWIVRLKASADPSVAAPGLARKAGGRVGHVYTHAIHGFQMKGSAAAAAALRRSARVLSVTRDHPVHLSETDPFGIERIDAFIIGGGDAYSAGFRGAGTRIAIIDTGIDLDHPDLAASIDASSGLNCVNPALPPNDGHGHGTHVSGTAAAPLNGVGVVGVAPEAQLVPIKTFDDAGNSSEALVLCGIDHVVDLNTDGNPNNDIDVANMSWGDPREWGTCASDPLHGAICAADAAGVVLIGGAGNNASDAGTFVPAAFPEVVSVSAIGDFDGKPGGLAGCRFIPTLLANQCDDAFAFFSNFGPSVDVAAPGVNVYSTTAGGGYKQESGTSMATPHVSGVAALVKGANPALTTAEIRAILAQTGELPDGTNAESECGSAVAWSGDRDGITEPLVNALRAAQRATDPTLGIVPDLSFTPADGASVSGNVTLSASASHASGIASVQFFVDGTPVGTDNNAPFSVTWDSTSTFDGVHVIRATATANGGQLRCKSNTVTSGVLSDGSWVGAYGVNGYDLAAWNGSSDLAVLPGATLTVEQGGRTTWAATTTDVRALLAPTGSSRRAATYWDNTQIRVRLNFASAYSGTLHLYAVDWDATTRRENVTVNDGSTTKTIAINASFNAGAWMHVPVSVPAGGSVLVTVDKVAGANAVLSGLFLGGAGTPPTPPPPPFESAPQGSWVGAYGVNGYDLAAWNGSSDLAVLPGATLTVEQGGRTTWAATTTDVRALLAPTGSSRRAATYWDNTQIRVRLNFASAYSGTLHLYAVDWDATTRRENVTVNDGSTTKTIAINASFNAGAWMHVPVSVPAGGSVLVTVDKVAGANAVLSGLFLGGAGTPPTPPPPPFESAPQGSWVGAYGVNGYDLAAWNGSSDLAVLPGATLTVEQGGRTTWAATTTDVRALLAPTGSSRRAATYWDNTQIRVRLNFASAYSGTLHLYAVDWDATTRRENVTVNDGSTTKTIAINASFNAGAWMHVPVSVPAGGSVLVTVDKVAGANAVLSGLFLGGAGTPPTPPPPPFESAPQGSWVGAYGVNGYDLAAWNGSSDLAVLPGATLTVEQGGRTTWAATTTDVRALLAPTGSSRRAATYWDNTQIRVRLNFASAYSGTLHLYAVDWDATTRRENVTVNDGSTTKTIAINASFNAGAWMHVPVSVPAGGSVLVTVDKVAGANAVLSGLFLGGAGTPPTP